MEIYQIRAFVTVARLGNLTKAADALSITQPAVTAQIKALEQSLGVALFDRTGGRLALAKAGEALLPTAESLLLLGAQLKAEAQHLQGSLHGIVELGIPSEQPDFLRLGELAAAVRDQLPLIELKTVTLSALQLHETVSTGRLHAALTIVVNPPRGTHWLPLRSVRYRIAMPAGLATALKRGGWRDVAQLPWLDGPAGCHTHLLLRDMFERHGLAPRVVMQHDDQANLNALVRAGAGCALIREEIAMAGAAAGDFIVWGQARADAILGFMISNERASEPVLVALSSLMQNIWKARRADPHPHQALA
ncbi:LysR family transcriptional regulator [Bordetella sp. 02P26C-1]|uniref:LysR family transcriptional regulator n=1 Tax=Bordetella sp. 02P26C-1 TaxID=2683195 RepID=UPI001353FBE1|nr:LysR family transcriptional regulator [Bordetella sp. 02P26C-1]MVW79669.1 LysR family transcriptional regulator [Bordetella sp. 02P26C-1]